MRTIAARLGLSAMSVSRALRGSPGVSEPVRQRILAAAGVLGYRPDPEVLRLMHLLRMHRRRAHQGLVCALTDRSGRELDAYCMAIVGGAGPRLERFGYRLRIEHFGEAEADRTALRTRLRNRGVEGLLLLPLRRTADISGLLDWSSFSVVAATSSLSAPLFHRVYSHQYANALALCDRLRRLGCARLGLVMRTSEDERSSHAYSAAVLWYNSSRTGDHIPGLILEGDPSRDVLNSWIHEHQADAVIAHDAEGLGRLRRLLDGRTRRRLRLAHLSGGPESDVPGVDLRPEAIGQAAADLLLGLLQRGERGIPEHPAVTLLHGALVGA